MSLSVAASGNTLYNNTLVIVEIYTTIPRLGKAYFQHDSACIRSKNPVKRTYADKVLKGEVLAF